MKILMGVIAFAICCTVGLIQDMLSLIEFFNQTSVHCITV